MSKEYKAIKNYIHNELSLTKDDIIKYVQPYIKEKVERCMFNSYGSDSHIEDWIRNIVREEIQRVDFRFIRDLYKEVLKEEMEKNIEIIVKLKEKEN